MTVGEEADVADAVKAVGHDVAFFAWWRVARVFSRTRTFGVAPASKKRIGLNRHADGYGDCCRR
jgi:hypothetical protein